MRANLAEALERLAAAISELADAINHDLDERRGQAVDLADHTRDLSAALRDGLKQVADALVIGEIPE